MQLVRAYALPPTAYLVADGVIDQGPGVPSERRREIFARHSRARFGDGNGAGLGLSLVKANLIPSLALIGPTVGIFMLGILLMQLISVSIGGPPTGVGGAIFARSCLSYLYKKFTPHFT